MSRVFRCDHRNPDDITGEFSILLFDGDDPKTTATRVFSTGLVSDMTDLWMLRDMLFGNDMWSQTNSKPTWYEITDTEEVQNFLRENPLTVDKQPARLLVDLPS